MDSFQFNSETVSIVVLGTLMGLALFIQWFAKNRAFSNRNKENSEPIEIAGAVIDKRQAEELRDAMYSVRNALVSHESAVRETSADLNYMRQDLGNLRVQIAQATPKLTSGSDG